MLSLVLWCIRIVIWNTPNNVLNQNGYGNAVSQDLFLGSLAGFIVAISVYIKRHLFQPKALYWASLLVSGSLAVAPIMFFFFVFIGVLFFGVSV